jgi:hypothetical protein
LPLNLNLFILFHVNAGPCWGDGFAMDSNAVDGGSTGQVSRSFRWRFGAAVSDRREAAMRHG